VNQLAPRQTYKLTLRVVFPQPAARVRFDVMIKTVEGLEVGGVLSHAEGEGLDFVEAKARFKVTLSFCANLSPGTYFADVGVVGEIDGHRIDLHRIIDATAFRVGADPNRPVTGLTDISVEPFCEVTLLQPNKQAAGAT
jgi:lipopolysaccharide transport system ATP-binding protein